MEVSYSETDLFSGSRTPSSIRHNYNTETLALVLDFESLYVLRHDGHLALEVNGTLLGFSRECEPQTRSSGRVDEYTGPQSSSNWDTGRATYCWLDPGLNANHWDVGDTVELAIYEVVPNPAPKPVANLYAFRAKDRDVDLRFQYRIHDPWTPRQRIVSYQVERSDDNGATWTTLPRAGSYDTGLPISPINARYIDRSARAPNTYQYRVSAIDTRGNVGTPPTPSP